MCLLASASFLFSSCGGRQSAVDAAGIQAERLESLWWLFFYVCLAVYVIVMAVLLTACFRSRRTGSDSAPDIAPNESRETRAGYTIKGAVAITLVVLFVLMFISFRTGRAINTLQQAESPLSIKITGNQWWWNVEYQDAIPSNNITTANELHLPVGRTVKIELQSNDVIHSIWLPNMHGKKRPDPELPDDVLLSPRQARNVLRPVCGILRLSACKDAVHRGSRESRRI
jgi:cytochrome c oxidase subunit 2